MAGPRDYSRATRAALVDRARGTCYFPRCNEPVIRFVDGEPYINCEIAHIRDANEGNRYAPEMTDDERRAFGNLVLLCKPHHELIDKRHPDRYSIADLEGWKTKREGSERTALEEVGSVSADELEAILRELAILTSDTVMSLGGHGGSALSAGGGGGGVIGSGTGGPGGPGGEIRALDGQPGSAPGAGGGGAGAIGPDAQGGEGGGGGAYASTFIEVEPETTLRVQVGEGGAEGRDGGDSWVAIERPDGSVEEILRASGGAGGQSQAALRDKRDGPSLMLTSAFLADNAQLRDGLVFALGGGWDRVDVERLPAVLSGSLVVVAEPVVDEPRVTDLLFEVIAADGASKGSASMAVEITDAERPLRLVRIFRFEGIEISGCGMWRVSVQSGGVELAGVPFRVVLADSAT